MDSMLSGIIKEGLVTDECDLVEDGHAELLNSSASIMPSEERDFLTKHLSSPRGTAASSPFEIEPGHFDFLQIVETYSSKQFSSDPGSVKGSTTKDESSCSLRRYSNQFPSTSSSVGNPKFSQFMSDWIEQPSVGSTEQHCDGLAIKYSSESARLEAANNSFKPCLGRAPPTSRVLGAQPSRVRVQTSRRGGQPCRVLAQPFIANYTWDDVAAMTRAANNQLLGKGGFGPVYMGILPSNKQVAVKILDDDSHQGNSEFLNEVDLLSRVNHVNLVKLVGYCQEGSDRVLVYEHAEEGTLWDHIHGNGSFLDWRTRLKVSLESACGLEYLHTGCAPRIIHRDIKSSNILLTKTFVAKVADFGLSKIGLEDEYENRTFISTVVKGTPGYLDPEYYKTARLNEKSDIYSFGVVLLEVITGRNPIERNADEQFIGDWVKTQWKSGGPKGVVDSRLGGAYNPKSMRAVVTLALKCLETSAKSRPDIRIVVEQLRAAIVREDNTLQASKWSLRSLLGQT